jgi:N-acetylglucosamine-6-phosphate deacetylase
MQRQVGLIASGRPADLIIMDSNFDVKLAMVAGEIQFNYI